MRISPININLIWPKCCPNIPRALLSIDVSEKRNTIQIYNTDMQYRYAILFMLFLFSFFFPNNCADRGSNRENSIEAC